MTWTFLNISKYLIGFRVTTSKTQTTTTTSFYFKSNDHIIGIILQCIIPFAVFIIIIAIIAIIIKCKKKKILIQANNRANNHLLEAQHQVVYTINSNLNRQDSVLSFDSALRNSTIVIQPNQQDNLENNILPTYEEYIVKNK